MRSTASVQRGIYSQLRYTATRLGVSAFGYSRSISPAGWTWLWCTVSYFLLFARRGHSHATRATKFVFKALQHRSRAARRRGGRDERNPRAGKV
jgi:hypothetical protein